MYRPEAAMTADACEAAAVGSADLIYRSAAAGNSCWARNHHGHRRELPMARWMGGPDTTPRIGSPMSTYSAIALRARLWIWGAVRGDSLLPCGSADRPHLGSTVLPPR